LRNLFTAQYFRLTKANKGQDFDCLTDKGPNILSEYDFWTITTFTNLGLALKMVIFRIFCSKFWGLIWPGSFFSTTKHTKKVNF
jgi:hypothetical protein